jgi:hypothetical protein
MNGTICGNALPRGTEVKKVGNQCYIGNVSVANVTRCNYVYMSYCYVVALSALRIKLMCVLNVQTGFFVQFRTEY